MPIKTILSVTSVDHGPDDLLMAADLAERQGAHLAAAVISCLPPPPVGDFLGQAYSTWSFAWQEERERVNARATELRGRLAERSLSGDVQPVYCLDSEVDDEVGTRARYADLCVIGASMLKDRSLLKRVLDGILFASHTPVVLVPQGTRPELMPKTVLVAWNARLEASAALRQAMEIVLGATDVRVVLVDPQAAAAQMGEEPGADVAAFLSRHGVRATVDVLASGGREPGLVLQQHAKDVGADLIVMGAYGHSRLRERVFGGTTQWTIENAEIPVLMAR